MHGEDHRLGRVLRLIRNDSGMTQVQLAALSGVPLSDVKRIEIGRAGEVRLGRIRSVFKAVDGRARLVSWWNGAAADRLLDYRHARIAELASRVLVARSWLTFGEVSFSEFGERGSIDILGLRESARAVAVCEVKSALGSLEETNRMLDIKERLAPTIVQALRVAATRGRANLDRP